MDPIQFVTVMLQLSEQTPFSVSSFWRTAKHNAAVGGMKTSHHLAAKAMDCVLDDRAQSTKLIAAAHAAGLQAVNEGDHIHIEVP
jgi:uncharacterized protein YcbK (DUF882 family)